MSKDLGYARRMGRKSGRIPVPRIEKGDYRH